MLRTGYQASNQLWIVLPKNQELESDYVWTSYPYGNMKGIFNKNEPIKKPLLKCSNPNDIPETININGVSQPFLTDEKLNTEFNNMVDKIVSEYDQKIANLNNTNIEYFVDAADSKSNDFKSKIVNMNMESTEGFYNINDYKNVLNNKQDILSYVIDKTKSN